MVFFGHYLFGCALTAGTISSAAFAPSYHVPTIDKQGKQPQPSDNNNNYSLLKSSAASDFPDDLLETKNKIGKGANIFVSGVENDDDDDGMRYDMPWSDVQEWALSDQLPKYKVLIPLSSNNGSGNSKKTQTAKSYALWRTMLNEVPELSGYPIEFLQKKSNQSCAALPYLDEFEFSSSGGVSGRVYGIPGLADGSTIETSPVDNVRLTLPKGFIRTSDGLAAYELGRPVRSENDNGNLVNVLNGAAAAATNAAASASGNPSRLLKNVNNKVSPLVSSAGNNINAVADDAMLVRLGATTAIFLAGATAFSMLSHHLTVNVFWV